MKIACTQENLSRALAIVSHISGKHTNLPILGNVLIRTDDKLIKLIATNLEVAVTVIVRGKIEEGGEYTVPAKLFSDYIGSLMSERVDVAVQADALEVRGGTSKTKIRGAAAADFPLIPTIERAAAEYRVPAVDFKKALGRVLFATSPNESRPEISGVLMRFESKGPSGTLVLAATDSYRLAEATLSLHEGGAVTAERSVIVPARTLAEIGRILGAGGKAEELPATIGIVLGENQILFSYGSTEVVSRLIEGQYPNYRAVIPEGSKTSVTLQREALLGAVKTTALFSRSGLYDVHLLARPGGSLAVSAADAQTGENETEVAADITGNENKLTLNHRYLVEGLSALDAPDIALRIIDAVNPCLLVPKEQLPGQHYLYVVMPIKQ